MRAIKVLANVTDSVPTNQDLICALLVHAGCSVSGMPREVVGRTTYSNRCELFDPELMSEAEIDDLPEPWFMVWKKHNEPGMGDCIRFRYRYVHIPHEILPQYPRVPCMGIFCLTDRSVEADKIRAADLIHIGNEFGEAKT